MSTKTTPDFVEVTTQAELDRVVEAGNIPIVRSGYFVASGSSTVRAYGSSTVRAYGSSTVEASRFVAVHKHSSKSHTHGGVVIEVPKLDSVEIFLDYYGLKANRGTVTLFKAVDDDYKSGHGFEYKPGSKPEAPDWNAGAHCGNGLHFSPTPCHARRYMTNATRFLACPIRVQDLVLLTDGDGSCDKVKAPRVVGKGCVEVDLDGEQIA